MSEQIDTTDDGGHRTRTYDPTVEHAFPEETLNAVLSYIHSSDVLAAYLDAQNVNPVDRMNYNDHGSKHIEIVRDRALRLYDLLKRSDVAFNGARQQGLTEADEPVIIALAATLHDVGHIVHRNRHPYYSIPIATQLLDDILPEFYDPVEAVKLKSETLHAILCHHTEETPLTTEAGVIRVADALDMERGRSRVPYEKGGRGINTLSSRAIQNVALEPGDDIPVVVEIEMTGAVGVYQVDSLLKAKLDGSGLEDHIRIIAVNTDGPQTDLVERIEL